jgi:hypothetical protein
MGPEYDSPENLINPQKIATMATMINTDPTKFGLTREQWKDMDQDVQLSLAAEMMGRTIEEVVGGELGAGGQGWPRHRDLMLETQRYMQTLGVSQQEQEATAQQPIASGDVIPLGSLPK